MGKESKGGWKSADSQPKKRNVNWGRLFVMIGLGAFFFFVVTGSVTGIRQQNSNGSGLAVDGPTPLPINHEETQAQLEELRVERVRVQQELDELTAQMAAADEAERAQLMTNQLRLQNESRELQNKIDNLQADLEHKQGLQAISASATKTHIEHVALQDSIEATRAYNEVVRQKEEADAIREMGWSWAISIVLVVSTLLMGLALIASLVLVIAFVRAKVKFTGPSFDPLPPEAEPVPSSNNFAPVQPKRERTVPETTVSPSETARNHPETVQNSSGWANGLMETVRDRLQKNEVVKDFATATEQGEKPKHSDSWVVFRKLDPTRDPTIAEKRMIRFWHDKFKSKKSVAILLYGHSNGRVYDYVVNAVDEAQDNGTS